MERSAQRGKKRWLYITVILLLLAGYCTYTLTRPLMLNSSVKAINKTNGLAAKAKLEWPKTSQSALGILDTSVKDTHNKQTPAPIASVAKVITALTVLDKYPLTKGNQGPTITLTDADVALYNNYASQNGSTTRVQAGEKISEYQMLQAIMLPSANNIADTMAIWAYGSLPTYTAAANSYLLDHGIKNTKVATDASGLSPNTVSTAEDLVTIGQLAMKNPVLAEIVGQSTAENIPVVGGIKNVNFLLGTNGIVGIKTGNTDQAGGVFLGASKTIVRGKPVTVVTAVVGSQTLFTAMKESLTLTQSAQRNLQPMLYATTGTPVGGYKLPWDGSAVVVLSSNLTAVSWAGEQPNAILLLDSISAKTPVNKTVGSVKISQSGINTSQSAPVHLTAPIKQPSIWWRLTHPLN